MSLLMDEWNSIGKVGRVAVAEPNEIILFVHESEKDKYTEIHYPSFDELRKNDKFVRRVADEHFGSYDKDLVTCDDDEFQFKVQLASWLRGRPVECPLFPVDVYFAADGMETFYTDFKDDPTLIAYVAPKFLDGSPWTRCNSYEELEKYLGKDAMTEEDEKHPKWWLVGRFSDGNLWMNNEEGCCYLESNNNLNLYYARKF